HLLRAGSIGDRLFTRARIGYTDANGEGGGITGGFRPEMLPVELFYSYRAYFNEPTPFAQSFASLLAPIPIIHFGFADGTQGQLPHDGEPAVSFVAIDRFRSAYSFTLSGLDRAAGSSVYYVVHHGRCGVADVASVGGEDLFDGQLTADDVIGFLTGYFAGDTLMCDLVGPGGVDLTDGQITPDDLVAFLSAFFAGCAQ
ncbi:MAG: GC-type dockerin domain-anchored protein, partial [Phycisphaerales bacterium]